MHKILAIVALLSLVFTMPAEARHRHHRRHAPPMAYNGETEQTVSHPYGCPRIAFCGCGVSVRIWGHPVRNLFLAANWFRFPHGAAQPGMVAVRRHPVMLIEGYVDANGNPLVYDPNGGGHRTYLHMRSLAGYSIRDPRGG